jgi:hypothetical protein
MKKVAYYHIYLDDLCTWGNVFMEQMKCLEDSGLIDNLSKIKITAITQPDMRIRFFNDLCKLYPVESEIEFLKNPHANDQDNLKSWSLIYKNSGSADTSISESHTLKKIWNDSQTEDMQVLYFHAKAITSTLNNLIVPGRMSKYRNRYKWRQFMNWGVLTMWKECVDALATHDTAGVDYRNNVYPHYSGNFWWANSSHLRMLPDPQKVDWWDEMRNNTTDPWTKNSSDRFRDELWICVKENTKAFNLKSNTTEYIANDI